MNAPLAPAVIADHAPSTLQMDLQAPTPRPLTAIEAAIAGGATPAQLQTLLELQVRAEHHQLEMLRERRSMVEEDRKREAELAMRAAFVRFRAANVVVPKTRHVDREAAGSFNQAEYDVVIRMITPALSANGLSVRHDVRWGSQPFPTEENPDTRIGWVWVTCYLDHEDGHTEKLELDGPEGDGRANSPVQNMQVTTSYLKRQSTLAITGTPTAEEDDETRMRRLQGANGERPAAAPKADPLASLRDIGTNKATFGMETLTKWWATLTARQRNDLSKDFKSWRSVAQKIAPGVTHG